MKNQSISNRVILEGIRNGSEYCIILIVLIHHLFLKLIVRPPAFYPVQMSNTLRILAVASDSASKDQVAHPYYQCSNVHRTWSSWFYLEDLLARLIVIPPITQRMPCHETQGQFSEPNQSLETAGKRNSVVLMPV
jgi:hypothetical protein